MTRQMDIETEGFDFRFTRNWFRNRNLPTFREHILPEWSGRPILYLELGVFEGMSMVWMLQHVLTHSASRAVGVDPWLMTTKLDDLTMTQVYQRAFHNVSHFSNAQLVRANSAEVLRRMCRKGYAGVFKGSVDLCMVDGNHNALAVWDDCRWVYKLLRPGGWMMLDDVENDIPKQDHVKQGLELFLNEQPMEQVFKHRYMEVYRK